MLVDVEPRNDNIAVLKLRARKLEADLFGPLTEISARLSLQGKRAILIDFSRVRRVTYGGLAGLVELMAINKSICFGFCALGQQVLQLVDRVSLRPGLPIYPSVDAALSDIAIRRFRLRGVRAVVLCAGRGSRIAPLSEIYPKPMLDILGRPVVERIVRHLETFGIRDFALNPGHLGQQIIDHFRQGPSDTRSLLFLREGHNGPDGWCARPLGSASTLQKLDRDHALFDREFLVLCGDAVVDLDIAQLIAHHRDTGAIATIAAQTVPEDQVSKYGIICRDGEGRVTSFQEKPDQTQARSRLANTGIYVFSPEAVSYLPEGAGQDIATDLLPRLLEHGGHVQCWAPDFSWHDVGCGRDYASVLQKGLRGVDGILLPDARQIHPGIWVEDGAEFSRLATVDGPCYVGRGARVERGAQMIGPSVLGSGAVAARGSVVRNSIILPDTVVGRGALVDRKITGPNWAFDYAFAHAGVVPAGPLDNVGPLQSARRQARRA